MSLSDFLGRLTERLDAAGVPYMSAGSVASSVYGEPRSTQDVDVVVELTAARLRALLELLPDDAYYVSADAARDALQRRGQFNLIDMATGWKADLIQIKARPFSAAEFARRRDAVVVGVPVHIATPEDVVLAKLEWAARGVGSERQERDVRGILAAFGDELDGDYLATWATALGVSETLTRLRDER